jgi:hypothetical protein
MHAANQLEGYNFGQLFQILDGEISIEIDCIGQQKLSINGKRTNFSLRSISDRIAKLCSEKRAMLTSREIDKGRSLCRKIKSVYDELESKHRRLNCIGRLGFRILDASWYVDDNQKWLNFLKSHPHSQSSWGLFYAEECFEAREMDNHYFR